METDMRQRGFTILELMIATVFFSVIMLICMTVIITISQNYIKGLAVSRTQGTTRTVIEDLTNSLKFSQGDISMGTGPNGVFSYCLLGEGVRYSFKLDTQVETNPDAGANQGYHSLWRDSYSGPTCTALDITAANVTGGGSDGREMIGEHMRLSGFSVSPPDGNGLMTVSVGIVYGDNDLLATDHSRCMDGLKGRQFCATSYLHGSIQKRL